MKKLLLVFSCLITIIVISFGELPAQPNYNFSSSQGAYLSIVGQPGTLPFNWRVTSSPNDEDFTFPLTILGPNGFLNPFPYDGVPFSQIQVSCNGYLKFCNSLAGDTLSTSKTTGATNKLTAFTRNVLAPLWDDLAVFNAAVDIVYQFAGPPGARVLTIEWNNVKWLYNSAVVNAGFQIRLYENNSWIEYQYGAFPIAPTSPSASVGMNDGTPISTTTTGVEATGTFLSINFGGTPGARTFQRSYGYEYSAITAGPDPVGPLPPLTTIFTFKPQVPIPMIGAYKVGGAPTPPFWFARLSDAAEALNLNGVGGPVILNLWPGPENDPGIPAPVWDDIFHLIPIVGSNPANTITVQVDPAYGGQVTIAPRNGTAVLSTGVPSATVGDAIIRLDGTSYTTISGASGQINLINNTQNLTGLTACEMGIFLGNAIVTTFNSPSVIRGARFNLFDRLYIDMNNSLLQANTGFTIGIRFGTNGLNADQNQTNSFNTIKDCEIVDFYRSAVYMFGFSSAVPDVGNVITGTFEQSSSRFHDAFITTNIQDCRVIEAYDQKQLLIENTDIYNIIASVLTINGVWGIRINPSATDGTSGTCTIRYCNIYNIENQNLQVTSGFACGIEVTSPYHEGIVDIYNNKVCDIYTNGSTTCRAVGMQLSLGAGGNSALNVYNNYIYDLRAPRSTTNPSVRGLDIQSASNVLTAGVYYNTIYLDGAVPVTVNSHYSTCLYWANFGTSSLDLRNNILLNDMSQGVAGTGIATCLYASANSNLLRLALTTNNNLLWANGPSPNRPIAYDVTNPAYQSLAAYQAAVTTGGLGGPRDDQAVTEFPPFIQPINPIIGGIPQNLHLNPAIATQAESGALPVPWIIADWDGNFFPNFRNPNFPDIGADEYNGLVVADVIPPRIFYTPLPNQNTLIPPSLVAQITDRSGVPPGNPTLWFKRTIDAAFMPVPGVAGPGPNDYTFPFNYAFPAPPIAIGDVIQYYVGSHDATGGPNIGTNPIGGGGMPPGVIPPPIFNTYTIDSIPVAGGTYTVGIAKFNQLIGKNLYPKTYTKIVKERVRVERNIEANFPQVNSSELIDLSLTIPGIDRDYDFDSTKFSPTEFVWKDVEKEYVELMDGDEIYSGPLYIDVTKEDLEHVGINTKGMENVRGWFTTLTAAVNELNRRGISGPVTLSLVDNLYNAETYPINLNSVPGVSSTNTITIKPAVNTQPVFSNANTQIRITNTSFVTIDGSNTIGGSTKDLTINRSATAGQAIWVGSLGTNPITDIAIKNCIIATGETGSSTPIMISDGATAGSSGYFSNIKIQNNDIKKGRQGIYVNGGIIPQYGNGIVISDNILNFAATNALKLYGIYIQGCNGVTVIKNDIGNFESATYENDRGIWIAAGTINAVVEKNIVHDLNSTSTGGSPVTGNGGIGIAVSSSSMNCNNVIRNNFIYNLKGLGSNFVNQNPVGIYLFAAQTVLDVYNNSIFLRGETLTQSVSYSAGITVSSGTFIVNVKNNVISNSLTYANGITVSNGSMGIFAFTSLSQFNSLDNNVYYLTPVRGAKTFGHVNGLGYLGFNQPLAAWKINSGLDINSLEGNPQYMNPSIGDLHISTSLGTPCESGGVNVGLADDIDGDLRNPIPDIGADEFNGTKYSITLDAIIEGLYNSGTNKMVTDTVKLYLRNISSPWAIVDSAISVLDSSGSGKFNFSNIVLGTSYYMVHTHRNSLETWSRSGGENFNLYAFSYDFTTDSAKAYGDNLKKQGSKWCIFSGDVNQDGSVDLSDMIVVDNDNANFVTGYVSSDVNGDLSTDLSDMIIVDNNNAAFVGKITPMPLASEKRKNFRQGIEINK